MRHAKARAVLYRLLSGFGSSAKFQEYDSLGKEGDGPVACKLPCRTSRFFCDSPNTQTEPTQPGEQIVDGVLDRFLFGAVASV